ncbi:SDR family oxidoreductase [Microbacterium oleivorans]|uniref:SDR family oxidoreductase n=1 Tax=Microbacterium oleivorans TaxID=273677 RepID=A0A7D5IS90_9MICO|nr:SDR family oxidoreductase [Microbacterium oleivorans]QLD11134.1 SDR family oxidoreductase [Microbacterium oleivorans]
MSRILIIGGHGKVALRLEPLLAERGDDVTAVIRNPEHESEVSATGATPLVADLESFDLEQLTDLLSGNDAVVWSAGAGGGDAARTWAVDRDAAIRSIDAARAAGVGRYVMVSYFGAGPDHGVPEDDSFYAYAEAKAEADAHLRESGLDWTIVAPSGLTLDEPTGKITVGGSGEASVSRGDVAAVIAAVLAEPATIGRTLEFTGGDTPIAEAITTV